MIEIKEIYRIHAHDTTICHKDFDQFTFYPDGKDRYIRYAEEDDTMHVMLVDSLYLEFSPHPDLRPL